MTVHTACPGTLTERGFQPFQASLGYAARLSRESRGRKKWNERGGERGSLRLKSQHTGFLVPNGSNLAKLSRPLGFPIRSHLTTFIHIAFQLLQMFAFLTSRSENSQWTMVANVPQQQQTYMGHHHCGGFQALRENTYKPWLFVINYCYCFLSCSSCDKALENTKYMW